MSRVRMSNTRNDQGQAVVTGWRRGDGNVACVIEASAGAVLGTHEHETGTPMSSTLLNRSLAITESVRRMMMQFPRLPVSSPD